MRSSLIAMLVLAASLSFPFMACAQESSLRQRMTPEQFSAAGLEKLSAQELAYLDQWLSGTLTEVSDQAAAQAKQKVESEHRGFFNFGSSEPVTARIQGEFRGFGKGRTWRLDNGQLWRQTDSARLAGVRLDQPQVVISPSLVGNAWYLQVEGYSTRAKVQREE